MNFWNCEHPYCARPLDHDGPCGERTDDDKSRRQIIEERDTLRTRVAELEALVSLLQSVKERQREALERFTENHMPDCDYIRSAKFPCDCGVDEAREALKGGG